MLLYTERAQFYNRHRLRGARAILFYQLPQHPQFYAELLNLLEEGEVAGEPPTGARRRACQGAGNTEGQAWEGSVAVGSRPGVEWCNCRARRRPRHPQNARGTRPGPRRPPQPPRPRAVTAVFSKFDALRLERVVGSARAQKMLKARKTGTFLFC